MWSVMGHRQGVVRIVHLCVCIYRPNEEKVVYFLLLSRKERQPSIEDEARALIESNVRGENSM